MTRSALGALWIVMTVAAQDYDLVVRNARVWTGETPQPWADSIAVKLGRIAAVGDVRGAARRTIDAQGRLVTPGFIDSHVHFLEGGFRLTQVQLREARTKADFVGRIAGFASKLPPGAWITGGDWDHSLWGGELPARQWIDAITSRHPVWVTRLDGHMGLANSLALKAAQVTAETADPDGGSIVRDPKGEPTGVLKDNAMQLVARVIAAPGEDSKDRALEAAMRYVAERGVTTVHHMGSWADLEVFERANRAGRLTTRIYAAVPLSSWENLRDRVRERGRGGEWLHVGLLKGFVDGSLGSRTAAMEEPFEDAGAANPADRGLLVNPPERLYQWIKGADAAGLHVAVHAIGDRANRILLDIFERVAGGNGARDRRFRVEHAQHLRREDIPRFGRLGVIASMQPYHAIDDGRWAEKLIGARRAEGTYAFRSLIDTNATLAFGSDWFVAPPSVTEGLYAAVTRATLDGLRPSGWVSAEKISVKEALRAYTAAGAYAAFEEKEKGTLAVGKYADFVMLDADVTSIEPRRLRDVRVAMTVVGGRVVFGPQH
jgi:predicted amidohydrolase YtcJ